MTKFIIENDVAIWGVGETEVEAWADMEKWMDTNENYSRDDFLCVEATDELVAEIERRGGAVSWGKLPNGVRCTDEQEADSAE